MRPHALAVYLDLAAASLASQMSYRRSFLLEILAYSVLIGIEVAAIVFLFDRFGSLASWSLEEVVLLYGIATLSYSAGDVLSSGLDRMPGLVRDGEFDRLLVRPVSPLVQVLAHEVALFRFGKVVPGVVACAVATARLDLVWGPREILLAADAFATGIPIYVGLHLVNATLCFWTVQSTEMMNAFTHGGHEMSKFPVSIYPPWMRRVFLYVIPLGLASYVPASLVLGKADPLGLPAWTPWAQPLVGVVFFALATAFWRFGLARYQSTGS